MGWPERTGVAPGLREAAAASAHDLQEVAERREAHEGVLALLVADRRGRAAVVVARAQDRVVGQRREPLRERVVHVGGVAPRLVGPPARAEEQRAAGDEATALDEALGARRVPGLVHEP